MTLTKFPAALIICNRRVASPFRDRVGAIVRKAMSNLPGSALKIRADATERIFIRVREAVPITVIVEEDILWNNFCRLIDDKSVSRLEDVLINRPSRDAKAPMFIDERLVLMNEMNRSASLVTLILAAFNLINADWRTAAPVE